MIEERGADIAATFHKAHDDQVMGLATEAGRTLGLAGSRQFGLVSFNDLASTTQRADGTIRCHREPDVITEMPSRFHTEKVISRTAK